MHRARSDEAHLQDVYLNQRDKQNKGCSLSHITLGYFSILCTSWHVQNPITVGVGYASSLWPSGAMPTLPASVFLKPLMYKTRQSLLTEMYMVGFLCVQQIIFRLVY